MNTLTSSLLPNASTTTIANILNQTQHQNQQSNIQQSQNNQNNIQTSISSQQPEFTIKQIQNQNLPDQTTTQIIHTVTVPNSLVTTVKKKKKKKPPKEKKPRPKAGEIRLKTALDGSLLYVCPECQVAYPEKEILESHMVVHHHSLERKFVCEVCSAALKRKDHLTRHVSF